MINCYFLSLFIFILFTCREQNAYSRKYLFDLTILFNWGFSALLEIQQGQS